jgi:SAM-dependent MidA family methyltransferase
LNKLSEKIRGEIARQGPITFARFMELALYCPDNGFYEKDDDTIGRRGDFYTSVSVGPVFGELLAFQFADWMVPHADRYESSRLDAGPSSAAGIEQFPGGKSLLIEAGAHEGRLANDILNWWRRWRPELFEQVEYWIVEPSRRRRQWQNETLKEFSPHVHWADSLAAIGRDKLRLTGVIFANELLDAMPVHRLGWDACRRVWFEWGVTWNDTRFSWLRLPTAEPNLRIPLWLSPELLEVLPDGFTTEICPLAEKWWSEAVAILQRGKLLAFDYGLEQEEFFVPHRAQGTLRAYRKHQQSNDILAHPGQQDITAHVNFSMIRNAGESARLRTESLTTQAQFLTGIAERFWREPMRNGSWTAKQSREFQTLVHPQHLGRAFRVLVQAR